MTFVISYCLPANQQYLYGYALVTPGGYPVSFFFDDTNAWRELLPFNDITQAAFTHDLAHGLSLLYGDGEIMSNHAETAPQWVSMDEVNLNFRALFPSDDPNFFFPFPLYRFDDDNYRYTTPTYSAPFVPKKIIAAIALEFDYKLTPVVAPLRYKFMTDEEFFDASLRLNGNVAGANWEPVLTTIDTWKMKDTKCDYKKYKKVAEEIKDLLIGMLDESVRTQRRSGKTLTG